MTIEEFDHLEEGMEIVYHGKIYDVISLDLEEKLILIVEYDEDDDEDKEHDIKWIRYENCEIIE